MLQGLAGDSGTTPVSEKSTDTAPLKSNSFFLTPASFHIKLGTDLIAEDFVSVQLNTSRLKRLICHQALSPDRKAPNCSRRIGKSAGNAWDLSIAGDIRHFSNTL